MTMMKFSSNIAFVALACFLTVTHASAGKLVKGQRVKSYYRDKTMKPVLTDRQYLATIVKVHLDLRTNEVLRVDLKFEDGTKTWHQNNLSVKDYYVTPLPKKAIKRKVSQYKKGQVVALIKLTPQYSTDALCSVTQLEKIKVQSYVAIIRTIKNNVLRVQYINPGSKKLRDACVNALENPENRVNRRFTKILRNGKRPAPRYEVSTDMFDPIEFLLKETYALGNGSLNVEKITSKLKEAIGKLHLEQLKFTNGNLRVLQEALCGCLSKKLPSRNFKPEEVDAIISEITSWILEKYVKQVPNKDLERRISQDSKKGSTSRRKTV